MHANLGTKAAQALLQAAAAVGGWVGSAHAHAAVGLSAAAAPVGNSKARARLKLGLCCLSPGRKYP